MANSDSFDIGSMMVISSRLFGSRSVDKRSQASSLTAFGAITESIPCSATPRSTNGKMEPGRSRLDARPQAAIAPPYAVCAMTFASACPPTVSIAPAQRSLRTGAPGELRDERSMRVDAPSRRR